MNIAELESKLFETFPAADAESWDNPGLVVGDRSAQVGKVACNLDMTIDAVCKAAQAGCNVLVTHHPAFIVEGPSCFGPANQKETPAIGRMIYEAARKDINLIAMHTNADRSTLVRGAYDELFDMKSQCTFESLQNVALSPDSKGFGMVYSMDEPLSFGEFAKNVAEKFESSPRVWGNLDFNVKKFAMLNGSWGDSSIYDTAISQDIDCLIVGETKYHLALDLAANISLIELGHDISELPIVPVLMKAIESIGVSEDKIINLDLSRHNWQVIERG